MHNGHVQKNWPDASTAIDGSRYQANAELNRQTPDDACTSAQRNRLCAQRIDDSVDDMTDHRRMEVQTDARRRTGIKF
jgi:hypothetical protein